MKASADAHSDFSTIYILSPMPKTTHRHRVETSISSSNQHVALRRFSADHIDARSLLVCKRHTTYCCLCLFLDTCLGLSSTVPMTEEESAVLDFLLELLVIIAYMYVRIAECNSLAVDICSRGRVHRQQDVQEHP